MGSEMCIRDRDWKNRVKGRDWYDLEWYIRNNIPLNIIHFKERLMKSGFLSADIEFTPDDLIKLLNDKIDSINIEDAKFDAMRFVHNKEDLRIWSRQYFHDLVRHLKFKN